MEIMRPLSRNRWRREIGFVLPTTGARDARHEGRQHRLAQHVMVAGGDCRQGLIRCGARVPARICDDERFCARKDVAPETLGHTALRVDREFLLSVENAFRRQIEVDAFGRGAKRREHASKNLARGGVAVRLLGENDGQPVATSHEEQALADRRGTIVAGAQLAPVHGVPMFTELAHEAVERLAFSLRIRISLAVLSDNKRPPCFELLNVFQHEDSRLG